MANDGEKVLLLHKTQKRILARPTGQACLRTFGQAILSILLIIVLVKFYQLTAEPLLTSPGHNETCSGQQAIPPQAYPDITEKNVRKLFRSEEFKLLSLKRLKGAVQIPTENFDDMKSVLEDKRWDVFYDLQDYFLRTFPLLHERLELEVVNEHGLVYTWRVSNSSIDPIMLTGHQDVVPIAEDTRSQWKYPPFSGHFDGTYINGRGSHDCKNNVLAILASVTALLEVDFTPSRTVVLAFGFDEEGPKGYGAVQIGIHLEKIWGPKAFAIILDEGAIGINHQYGRTIATPGASEKGSMDVLLRVHVPGGHSSMAPPHTSIGIVSEAITALEAQAKSNFPSKLTSSNPFYYLLHCVAADPNTDLSEPLRKALNDPNGGDRAVGLLADDFASDVLLRTVQAVTIFKSGSKSNALPQFAETTINYRISNEQSVPDVQNALIRTIQPIAKSHKLHFTTRDEEDNTTSSLPLNTMSLSWKRPTVPSPVSTMSSDSWKYLVGIIKHVFDEPFEGGDVLVAPTLCFGNTDTRFYWSLSDQIYRFGPLRAWHDDGIGNVHDVDERISLEAHLESILFYHEFIRVFDEAVLEQ